MVQGLGRGDQSRGMCPWCPNRMQAARRVQMPPVIHPVPSQDASRSERGRLMLESERCGSRMTLLSTSIGLDRLRPRPSRASKISRSGHCEPGHPVDPSPSSDGPAWHWKRPSGRLLRVQRHLPLPVGLLTRLKPEFSGSPAEPSILCGTSSIATRVLAGKIHPILWFRPPHRDSSGARPFVG